MLQAILEDLDKEVLYRLLDRINVNLYWKDLDGRYLGCNRHFLEAMDFTERTQILGKTDYDLFSKEEADRLRKNDLVAIQNAKFEGEECIVINKQLAYYFSTKSRLINRNGEVIGVFGSSICITEIKHKMEQEKQLAVLEEELKTAQIVDLVPAFIYWRRKNGPFIACNQYLKEQWGADISGKTMYEILSKEDADKIEAVDQHVLDHGSYDGEDVVTNPLTGMTKYFFSSKRQLRDSKDNVIGTIGVSMDITDRKKAEQKIQVQQKEFRQIVEQVVHDIRSPLATMQMILSLCKDLPENLRVPLQKSTIRILDITNNLLNKFKPERKEKTVTAETSPVPTLISDELIDIMTEKKYEYTQSPIDFTTCISQNGYFAFLNIDMPAFKRMMSNLINNAVEAFEGRMGEIIISLEVIENIVQIIVQDNAKGMSEEIKANILNNITVTAGKHEGHGIGFNQIRRTLAKNNGTLNIDSAMGVGTKIILTFPKIEAPEWVAEKIEVYSDDLIIILDDDDSIHGAWEARFKQTAPRIERKHFKDGKETVSFVNSLSLEKKDKIFFLTDYELLSQNLHGLDVVKQTGIKRSILVTSHHNNQGIRELAKVTKTKILPKPLAPEIEIIVLAAKK